MTLNLDAFDDKSKKTSKTKYKAALGVGSVVSLFGIGSTLAANISLNGGGNVEFGQGVATTAACDEDGFFITPVTRFDNQVGIFKVDYVQVSGVNLTAEGTGWDDIGLLEFEFASQAEAKEQFPGQYYDTDANTWKNTCDGVVLDFKAYTDDVLYLDRTVIGEPGSGEGSLQDPIGWYQQSSSSKYNVAPGFALVADISDEGNFESNYAGKNWAVAPANNNQNDSWSMGFGEVNVVDPEQSSFQFFVWDSRYQTNSASISKITVQSMKTFPSSYYADREGLGSPENWYWDLDEE